MYINLLTVIKNAQAVQRETIKVPFTNMDFAIAELLAKHKYIEGVAKKGRMPKRILEVTLKYKEGKGAISKVQFLSKPSRSAYVGYKDIRPVRQGYGLLVVSTSKGIMDGKSAKRQKLGGQLLFQIW
ncbi:30S ribosomal protein S8 [Candidatus Wolfebacteria bacterium]|nr:30S ribosomal protein S8 [Candidatus Wolfebacteria bacterium]